MGDINNSPGPESFNIKHCVFTLTARDPLDSDPPDWEHRRVMIDMKKGDLTILFAENEENRIKKLN